MHKLLNANQAADYLGISPKSLANSRWSGTGIVIPFVKIGGACRYKQSDLDKYIEERTFSHTGKAKEAAK